MLSGFSWSDPLGNQGESFDFFIPSSYISEFADDPEGLVLRHRWVELNLRDESDRLYLPEQIDLNLFDDLVITVKRSESRRTDKNIEVWKGRMSFPEVAVSPRINVMLLLDHRTQMLSGSLYIQGHYYYLEPVNSHGVHLVVEFLKQLSEQSASFSLSSAPQTPKQRSATLRRLHRSSEMYGSGETPDSSDESIKIVTESIAGVASDQSKQEIHIVDLFVGFSDNAARRVADLDLIATQMVEEVNTALSNSEVHNVRLNMLGTGTSPENPGVVSRALYQGYNWFAEEIAHFGPDYVALVQTPTRVEGEAGGWAGVGGYISNNAIYGSAPPVAVFRHEMGHNIGGGHCPGGSHIQGYPYAHGYDNGDRGWRTILCGNDLNMYSNPDLQNSFGHPLGNTTTANMARVWRERAQEISNHRVRVIHPQDLVISTLEDTLENDGHCTLREAVINDNESSLVWEDCPFSVKTHVHFDPELNLSTLVLRTPLTIEGDIIIGDEQVQIIVQAPAGESTFIVEEDAHLRLNNITLSGQATILENRGLTALYYCEVMNGQVGLLNSSGVIVTAHTFVHKNDTGIENQNGSLTIRHSRISRNRGAGIASQARGYSPIFIDQTTISDNHQGIKLDSSGDSTAFLHKCTVSGNGHHRDVPPEKGGGFYVGANCSLTMQETTISGNKAIQGSAIYIEQGADRLLSVFNTIAHNSSASGEGAVQVKGASTDVRINQTIVADQLTGQNCQFEAGSSLRFSSFNLVSDDSCHMKEDDNNITDRALLAPLAANGGETQTHALQDGSMAINGSTYCCCTDSDQRGVYRSPDICDIGAYQTYYHRLFDITTSNSDERITSNSNKPITSNSNKPITTTRSNDSSKLSVTKGAMISLLALVFYLQWSR